MAPIKKKGKTGAAKNYVTRNQALRKLQINLPEFRKLCIWKGIYPREPRDRKKVSKSATHSTTFYYAKDIQYLLHEPLLQKFRDQKVLEKKISRALGRGDVSGAKKLDSNAARPEKTGKPRYTLDHVVRERYPTFADAVRDLDDCLSMLFLFAQLPTTDSVPAKMISRCERLCLEFQHYVITSHSLKKSFLSIKGIYYQANIQGEDVLWLVPYKFNQRVVGDIDFRIMGTFVEFYMTLLGFVNFRLYTSIGLKYPPKFDEKTDDRAGELGAFTIEGKIVLDQEEPKQITDGSEAAHGPDPTVQAAVNKVIEEIQGTATEEPSTALVHVPQEEDSMALDKFEPAAPGGDILPQPLASGNDASTLFSNCTFYLSRETPRQPLEFLLRSFGCKRIGWDSVLGDGAFTTNERDPRITHQIVDRPVVMAAANSGAEGEDSQTLQKLAPNQRMPGRVYVQPQWVWDSVNDEELKHPAPYAPGAQLPPHLSPFVQSVQGQYDPTVPLEEQETAGEALEAESDVEDDENAVKAIEPGEGMDVAEEDEDEESDAESGFAGFSGDEDEEEETQLEPQDVSAPAVEEDEEDDDDAVQRQLELEAELAGAPIKPTPQIGAKAKARQDMRKALAKKAKEDAEELQRAKGMMSKKKRKLLEKMEYSNNKKADEARQLRSKRRKIESGKA